jgi:hypothetical protein
MRPGLGPLRPRGSATPLEGWAGGAATRPDDPGVIDVKTKTVKLPSKPKFVVDEKCPRCGSTKIIMPVEMEQNEEGLWIAYQEICQNDECDFCKVYKVKFYPSANKVFIC